MLFPILTFYLLEVPENHINRVAMKEIRRLHYLFARGLEEEMIIIKAMKDNPG